MLYFLAALALASFVLAGLAGVLVRSLLSAAQREAEAHRAEVQALFARLGAPVLSAAPPRSPATAPKGRWVEDPEGLLDPVWIPQAED